VPEPTWTDRAACLDVDPDLFFSRDPDDIDEATAVCSGCDVRTDCLTWAIEHNETAGVWGGLTEDQRRSWRRLDARSRRRTLL
jgi:WhiB family redox-sensing transcriptional regulator